MWPLPSGSRLDIHSNMREKSHHASGRGRGKKNYFVVHHIFQSLTDLEVQASVAILSHQREKGKKKLAKFTVQRHSLTRRLRLNHRTDYRTLHIPLPIHHHHIIKGLFTGVPFIWYIMSSYQEKLTRHVKEKNTT